MGLSLLFTLIGYILSILFIFPCTIIFSFPTVVKFPWFVVNLSLLILTLIFQFLCAFTDPGYIHYDGLDFAVKI